MNEQAEAPKIGANPARPAPDRALSEAAQRALAEAEARRAAGGRPGPVELNGRGGLEPVRYGDWEVNGMASDF